jgi:hypothetical protein
VQQPPAEHQSPSQQGWPFDESPQAAQVRPLQMVLAATQKRVPPPVGVQQASPTPPQLVAPAGEGEGTQSKPPVTAVHTRVLPWVPQLAAAAKQVPATQQPAVQLLFWQQGPPLAPQVATVPL